MSTTVGPGPGSYPRGWQGPNYLIRHLLPRGLYWEQIQGLNPETPLYDASVPDSTLTTVLDAQPSADLIGQGLIWRLTPRWSSSHLTPRALAAGARVALLLQNQQHRKAASWTEAHGA